MASNYSLFVFAYNLLVPPSAISECLTAWTKCEVDRIDFVMTATTNTSYYFVHFKNHLPENVLKMLESGQKPMQTRGGDIKVALDKSTGLDPNTVDTVVQFIVNKEGSFHRYLNKPTSVFIWDEEAGSWLPTIKNPFEIQEVEMEDDVSTVTQPFATQSVDGTFYNSDDESTVDQAPWAPIKKQQKKRYVKSDLEIEVCRTLFV
jgi:hypothetical protein